MQESKFRCYVEIPLYITTLALVFGLSSETFIEQKLLNPSPTAPYCMPDSYPVGCSLDDNPECRVHQAFTHSEYTELMRMYPTVRITVGI